MLLIKAIIVIIICAIFQRQDHKRVLAPPAVLFNLDQICRFKSNRIQSNRVYLKCSRHDQTSHLLCGTFLSLSCLSSPPKAPRILSDDRTPSKIKKNSRGLAFAPSTVTKLRPGREIFRVRAALTWGGAMHLSPALQWPSGQAEMMSTECQRRASFAPNSLKMWSIKR